jgi:hypothetical protein
MSGDPITQGWGQALDARMAKAVEQFDGLVNFVVGGITERMDGASAALVEKVGDMGASMARGANSLSASISPNSLSGPSKSSSSPSQEMAIEKSAGIPEHVKTQAIAAVGGGGTGVAMPTLNAANSNERAANTNLQMVHVAEADLCTISPTPGAYGVQTQSQVRSY